MHGDPNSAVALLLVVAVHVDCLLHRRRLLLHLPCALPSLPLRATARMAAGQIQVPSRLFTKTARFVSYQHMVLLKIDFVDHEVGARAELVAACRRREASR